MEACLIEDWKNLNHLDKGARPTVDEEQRYSIGGGGLGVQEMHFNVPEAGYVHVSRILGQMVESRFLLSPTVAVAPEVQNIFDLFHGHAVLLGPFYVGQVGR